MSRYLIVRSGCGAWALSSPRAPAALGGGRVGSVPPLAAPVDAPPGAAQGAPRAPHERADERSDEDEQPPGPRELPHQELDRHVLGVLEHEDEQRPRTGERRDRATSDARPPLLGLGARAVAGAVLDHRDSLPLRSGP